MYQTLSFYEHQLQKQKQNKKVRIIRSTGNEMEMLKPEEASPQINQFFAMATTPRAAIDPTDHERSRISRKLFWGRRCRGGRMESAAIAEITEQILFVR